MITDIIDKEALQNHGILRLPSCVITCPECGTLRGPEEIHFIKMLGYCEYCSGIPAIVRKERATERSKK